MSTAAYRSPTVSYGCTALRMTNKRGILKCTEDGYYTVVLGALNIFNSAGMYYPLGPAKAVLDASSAFQRRIAAGALHGECGHPRPQPGQNEREWRLRLNDIYEPNISHHIRKVWLEDGHTDKNGRQIVMIMGEVKPAGPRGPALKEALENRFADVCFSIRCFTHDIPVGSVWHKQMRQCVTFDWVNEPGIAVAHKWNAPGLESMMLETLDESTLTRELVVAMAQREQRTGVGLESASSMTSLVKAMGWDRPIEVPRPPSMHW